MVTVVYKIWLEMWDHLPPEKLAALKYHNFGVISDNFATWLRISLAWNKIPSIGRWHCNVCTLLCMPA